MRPKRRQKLTRGCQSTVLKWSKEKQTTTGVSGHYLVEKCCANTFPDDVPIRPTRDHLHFLLLHDFLQLRPNLSDLTHGFAVDEVVRAPLTRISVAFPLVQEGQMRRLHSHLFFYFWEYVIDLSDQWYPLHRGRQYTLHFIILSF